MANMPQANTAAKRLLLLTDWVVKDNNWSFLRELIAIGHPCEHVGVQITREYGSRIKKVIYLWCGYFLIGLKGFLRRKGFDFVIAYQGVAGLFYSFFRMGCFQKKPQLVLMAFFFKKRKNRIYNQMRYYFTKVALGGVDKVVCYSSQEANYYNELFKCRENKFEFVPYGVNVSRLNDLLAKDVEIGDYVFSAGSSNRDYKTLFEAVEDVDLRVVVFAKKYNVSGMKIPSNVEMMYDVYGSEFDNYLLGSKFVVVPLQDPELSSGQMVLLEAMALGKAVLVTETWGTRDYVIDGFDGMLVDGKDSKSMRSSITELLQSDEKIATIGKNARASVLKKFTVGQMATGVSKILN